MVAWLAACGGPGQAGDAARSDVPADAPTESDASTDASLPTDDVVAAPDAGSDARSDAGPQACRSGALTDAIARCIDMGGAPRSCLLRELAAPGVAPVCDLDHDGMADDLEDAMGKSYALAFAFNQGDGTHTGGNPEPLWPDNVEHYVRNSQLVWRVDNDDSTLRLVDPAPTLATLGAASIVIEGTERFGRDPRWGHGTNFWLCLRQVNGGYTAESQVRSLEASRTLAGGIDVAVVVHPTTEDPMGRFAFVSSVLYYAYNEHSSVDDHEGDWEGGGVIVDMETGRVVAAYFDRHNSSDNVRLLPLMGEGAVPAIDPSAESTFGNVCNETDAAAARGVRFWDYAGARHHAVLYVSTGGHASYGYPGNTKILGAGCWEYSIVRDTHNGDGAKFLPWQGVFVADWRGASPLRVVDGVHFINVGEDTSPRVPWAAYHGQWGCQHNTIAKSYPGPWDNERHCRRWITHRWGASPPFMTANPSADCSGSP